MFRVGVHDAFGSLALATMLGTWLFMAYPAWCAWSLRTRLSLSRRWLLNSTLAMTAIVSLSVIPASLFDMGWIVVPTLLFLLALDTAHAYESVRDAEALDMNRGAHGPFVALFVPLLVLLGIAVTAFFGEASRMLGSTGSSVSLMSEAALGSFAIIGLLPLVVVAFYMPIRHSGIARRRREGARGNSVLTRNEAAPAESRDRF